MFWEYDTRLGRRWNRDLFIKASQSPFVCFNNNPIVFADPLGLDGVPKQHETKKGDTYSSISIKYKVSVENLRKWNKYPDTRIPIGVKLIVSDPTKPLHLGSKGQVNTGEDSKSGTDCATSTPEGTALVEKDKNDGIEENSKDYQECSDLAIDNDYFDRDWHAIRDKFLSGKGGLIGGLTLIEDAMKSSSVGIKLNEDIVNYFTSEMKFNKGNYSAINFNNSNIMPPGFSGVSKSLLALVGGTQQLDVYLSSITIHGQSYTATLTYYLFDDYGISESDFLKANTIKGVMSGCREGLVAMWILQHCKGYKPLTTCFKFTTTFKGTF